eukprot:TRINITY_DN98343_c0_g1_i1.p1 TRINITY_DN98343_c0_g1~~TRINITY_DN98343_c0_g1_i1.p1  ORF type:complete len:179 (+),score=19.18 TRINITY_DN98343_c0_g1_i1:50-586(+)
MDNSSFIVDDVSGAVCTTAPDQTSLFSRYISSSDAYFSSPNYVLLAKPPFANLLVGVERKNLTQRVLESLRFAKELGHINPVVVGAVPFDINKPPYLHLSTNAELNKKKCEKASEFGSGVSTGQLELDIFSAPDAETFKASVIKALDLFEEGELEKVVLSRTLRVSSFGMAVEHIMLL